MVSSVWSGLYVSTFGGLRIVVLPVIGIFVTVSEPRHTVLPNTLSMWICQVIRRVYNVVSQEECHLTKVTSHEVHAVATSALFRKVRKLARPVPGSA